MNLTFSFVLKPSFLTAQDQFSLNMAISLGLYDYLCAMLNARVSVKWPNDIWVDEKKVCGILIENSLQGLLISSSVVGVGLNVNQQRFEHPRAASMRSFSGKEHLLQAVLDELLPAFESRYLQLRRRDVGGLSKAYHRALYGFGLPKIYKAGGREFEGTIVGLDEIGRLKIDGNGGIKAYGLKEVELVS